MAIYDRIQYDSFPVVLTIQPIRFMLQNMVCIEMPALKVLAYNELPPLMNYYISEEIKLEEI